MTELTQALQEISTRLTGIEKVASAQSISMAEMSTQMKTINNRGCQRGEDITKHFNTQFIKLNEQNSNSIQRVHTRIDNEAKDVTRRLDRFKIFGGGIGAFIAAVAAYLGMGKS